MGCGASQTIQTTKNPQKSPRIANDLNKSKLSKPKKGPKMDKQSKAFQSQPRLNNGLKIYDYNQKKTSQQKQLSNGSNIEQINKNITDSTGKNQNNSIVAHQNQQQYNFKKKNSPSKIKSTQNLKKKNSNFVDLYQQYLI